VKGVYGQPAQTFTEEPSLVGILRGTIREIEQHEEHFPGVYGPKAAVLQRVKELLLAAMELQDVEPPCGLPTICCGGKK